MRPQTKTRRPWHGEHGFTLVELTIATTLLLVILAAALPLMTSSQHTEADVSTRADKIQKARVLAERLGRDLRSAYLVVATPTASTLTFETYVRRTACGNSAASASSVAPIRCRVVYTCSAGTCLRTERAPGTSSGGTTRTLVSGLSDNNVFNYAPSSSHPTFVGLRVVFPSKVGGDAVTLEDGTALRNISP